MNKVRENYAISNKLENLIPIVNPKLRGKSGIEAALLYRIDESCKEVDSSELVREAYKIYYGTSIPSSSDTILNAFIPFMDFCRAKLFVKEKRVPKGREEQYRLVYENLDEIFNDYIELKNLFDKYFNLMYSFSNFMPVPPNFNGSKYRLGKGTAKLNKDYPYEYMNNLKDPDSGIYEREKMYKWLTENMDSFKIKEMYNLKPPYPIREYYGYDDCKLDLLTEFLKKAIDCIEKRFI